jgi:hypothetical protein
MNDAFNRRGGRRGKGRSSALAVVLALALGASARAQLPPIGIAVTPQPGWEDVTESAGGAATVLQRRGQGGGVDGSFNVVISESAPGADGALTDPGVAEGIERQLVAALPGAKVTERGFTTVAGFKAFRLTAELSVGGRPKVLRQTTVDVRRGAVTATAVVDAAAAGDLLAQVDRMVESLKIDAAR